MTEQSYPIVMRMEGMRPDDLAGYEGHRLRKGGDLGHVDRSRSHLNRRLVGEADWAPRAVGEIEEMRLSNFADELEGLKRRRRTADLARRLAEGPKDPWRASRHGPMREVILTANRKWFDADLTEFLGEDAPTLEQRFEALAVSWLKEHFGEDVIHARADLDEQAYHVHAVILPRAVTKDGRRMLQPSKHAMIKDYEAAQDSVGEWFAPLGLVRGEKRKAAVREAVKANAEVRKVRAAAQPGEIVPEEIEVPLPREHVSPRAWREAQEAELAERRKAAERRDAEADARERGLDEREDGAAVRNAQLDRRETDVEKREEEASAVLDVAAEVAGGRVVLTEPASAAASESEVADGGKRSALARSLFARALARLREQARSEAKDELASAYREIVATDDFIVEIAAKLPAVARNAIVERRGSLSVRILALRNTLKKLIPNADRDDRDP